MKPEEKADYLAVNSKPKVTIGMPVYNGEAFINKAIESLLLQTFDDFELIISDNASEDGTGSICLKHASEDGRIRYVKQEKNWGPFSNFEFVLEEARGEYFMWAAADDVWHSDFIRENLAVIESDKKIAVSFCNVRCINQNSEVIQDIKYSGKYNISGVTGIKLLNKILSPYKYNIFIYGLHRSSVLKKYFYDIDYYDRWMLIPYAIDKWHVGHVDKVLYYRLINTGPIEDRHAYASDTTFLKSFFSLRQYLYHITDRVRFRSVMIEISTILSLMYITRHLLSKRIKKTLLSIIR
jgi:glycosyltransferase involved in cell wall biosynthesis